jgi:hypothetical protein
MNALLLYFCLYILAERRKHSLQSAKGLSACFFGPSIKLALERFVLL